MGFKKVTIVGIEYTFRSPPDHNNGKNDFSKFTFFSHSIGLKYGYNIGLVLKICFVILNCCMTFV